MAHVTVIRLLPLAASHLATGINERGAIVGNAVDSWGRSTPFIWQPASPNATTGDAVMLDALPSAGSTGATATAINRHGDVVGFSQTVDRAGATVRRAVRWPRGSATPVPLGTLILDAEPGAFVGNSRAFGINDAGDIVGVSDSPTGESHGFRFDSSSGVMFDLLPGGPESAALGINNAAQVVGWVSWVEAFDGQNPLTVRRAHCGGGQDAANMFFSPLASPPGNSVAYAINNHGQIVGEAAHYHGPLATNATWFARDGSATAIMQMPFSVAHAVNDPGVVVGSRGQGVRHGYRFSEAGLIDLCDLSSEITITHAAGINNAGQIVGSGTTGSSEVAVLISF